MSIEITKKLRELLTKSLNLDSIEITDNDLLTLHNEVLASYTDADAFNLISKVAPFQSIHDKHVTELVTKVKTESDELLTSKQVELEEIKNSIPRADSPEEIKKKLLIEKDPAEIRILQLELSNALTNERAMKLESDGKIASERVAQGELKVKLDNYAKEKGYQMVDSSMFLQFGDEAIEKLDVYGAQFKDMFDSELSKIATEKYGVNPVELGTKPPPKRMTYDDIEKSYPGEANREKRLTLYEENGL